MEVEIRLDIGSWLFVSPEIAKLSNQYVGCFDELIELIITQNELGGERRPPSP